jgi:hypothetical protein
MIKLESKKTPILESNAPIFIFILQVNDGIPALARMLHTGINRLEPR